MQPSGLGAIRTVSGDAAEQARRPWLVRILGKIVIDVMPGALASLIGTLLIAQYQFAHQRAPQLVAVQPASADTMARLRDEHAMIMDYLKTQMAAEQNRNTAADEANARAAEDAKLANEKLAAEVMMRLAATTPVAKPAAPHVKAPAAATVAAAAPQAPLVIAEISPEQAAPPSDRLASDPNSLLAKTLDLKDHVVAAAHHAVSAIGDVFTSIGDHIGGAITPPAPRQFTSNS
jgi:hypothetical protein